MAVRRIHKISKWLYGSFKFISGVGDVVFQLELPPSSKIHPIFHVSQLKPCFENFVAALELPLENVGNQPTVRPLTVLN